MEQIKEFFFKNRGAVIGALVAIILLILKIHKFLLGCLIIFTGAAIGNYVQKNKEKVKENIRRIVDKW